MRRAAWFILIAFLAQPLLAQEPPLRAVTVIGEGEVFAAPDMATLRLGVVERAEDATAALRRNNAAMAELFAVLDQAEVTGADRQTSGLNLSPVFAARGTGTEAPQVIAYTASNTLTVRVRDLRTLGKVIDDLAGAGANRIDGITFGLADRASRLVEARRLAVEDALARATLYAETAGAALGDVITIEEQGGFDGPRPQMMEMAMSARMADNVPVAGGEVGLTARVRVVFALQ